MGVFRAWFYGPNGEARIFTDARGVPAGWRDKPFRVLVPVRNSGSPAKPEGGSKRRRRSKQRKAS